MGKQTEPGERRADGAGTHRAERRSSDPKKGGDRPRTPEEQWDPPVRLAGVNTPVAHA